MESKLNVMKKERQRILRAHYARLLKKAAAWTGLVAMMATTVVATPVSAAQLTSRSATLGSSAAGATTNYTFTWTSPTATTIQAIKFQMCDSPLEQTTCTQPSSGSLGSATFQTTSPTTAGLSAFAISGTQNSTQVIISNGSSAAAAGSYTVRLNNVTNPNVANTSFYLRITTYSNTAASTQIDYGAMAVSTANQVQVSANVQESLTFCVGTSGTGCGGGGLTGTQVDLGTGTDNVLSASVPSGGISLMAVDTNASTGYAITYLTSSPGGTGGSTCPGSLSSTNDCIANLAGTGFTAGTSGFGINLVANATPAKGAAKTGDAAGTVNPSYNTADQFQLVTSGTAQPVASATGPTLATLYTVTYAAQAGSTTKPGAYSATFTWVATGNF